MEDTQLDVEGADVGVNVRWLMDNLGQFEGPLPNVLPEAPTVM